VEPADAIDVREYLEDIYGNYLEVAFRESLRSRRPYHKFLRLLNRRHAMDIFTLQMAAAYFELRYRGNLEAMVPG